MGINHAGTVALRPATEGALAPSAGATFYASNRYAESTRRRYRGALERFVAWCGERGVSARPAAPETVADYLAALADAGKSVSTISAALAAIGEAHDSAGYDSPTKSGAVRDTMAGIRRTLGTRPDKKAPATQDAVKAMAAACGSDLQGLRDRAVLLLGFAGAFRRSELAALTVADLEETPEGLVVTLPRSKTDQEGKGQTVPVRRGGHFCPVAAVNAWLEAAGIEAGPIFRPFRRGGHVQERALSAQSVRKIVRTHAAGAGLDPNDFGAHSLRSGFATSAARAGASVWKLQEVTRHKSLEVLNGYIQDAQKFTNHAGEGLL